MTTAEKLLTSAHSARPQLNELLSRVAHTLGTIMNESECLREHLTALSQSDCGSSLHTTDGASGIALFMDLTGVYPEAIGAFLSPDNPWDVSVHALREYGPQPAGELWTKTDMPSRRMCEGLALLAFPYHLAWAIARIHAKP